MDSTRYTTQTTTFYAREVRLVRQHLMATTCSHSFASCHTTGHSSRAARVVPAARPATASSIKAQLPQLRAPFAGSALVHAARSKRDQSVACRAAKTDLEAYVWAVDGKELACPMCESMRLILNEKQLSYDREQVDYGNKPDWLQQAGGDMPVLKFVPDGSLHSGLENITNFLETQYPEPSIGKTGSGSSPSETKEADWSGVWEAFQSAQKSGDSSKVADQLQSLDKTIQEKVGDKYFGGSYPDITDLVLGPRLHHMEVILKNSGGWPSGLEATEKYLGNVRNLAGWAAIKPSDSDVEAFWKQHAGKC